jgi:hypothetical protein
MKAWIVLGAFLVTSCWFGSTSPTPLAQGSQDVTVGPDGRTTERVEGIYISQAADAPFTARQQVEWAETLADGTIMTTKYFTIIARDSRGRVYRENRNRVPANSSQEPRLNYTFVLVPDARTRTDCYTATQICRVSSYRPVTVLGPSSEASAAGKTGSMKLEPLGNDTMESLEVIGTRETQTIRAGTIGNNRDIGVTKEIWYSPQLQINLAVVRNDPRVGKQTFKITEVTLGEPDTKFFETPAGYRLVDERKESE